MTPVPPRVYLQDTCLKHKFIRSKETSDVYERPERIRAINIAIAAIYARLEEANPGLLTSHGDKSKGSKSTISGPLTIIRSDASLDMRVHKASLAVHSGDDTDGTQWFLADDIEEWCVKSYDKVQRHQSEIPDRLEQDLYLCPESLQAFEAAIGTVCEAVDNVCKATGVAHESSNVMSRSYKEIGHPSPRAFVVIRPPGHHCGEDSPAGFGFVNNVAVGAFHAFEEHRLSRVVIFDYDLHHGNGTQEIVRAFQTPKIYYGSMHDILSYPCEAGNQELISDASLQLHGVDGEWVHNVHILPYKTEEEFWKHYKERYSTIFTKAEEFLRSTGGPGDDVIVFLSCGFDASEYETTEMSRHDRHVPTSFYHRFTREACAFADKWAGGRLVSVLEGGYSDKALTSGAISHLAGLAEAGGLRVDKNWWSPDELNMIEKVTSKRRGRKPKLDHFDWWLQRMQQIFHNINKEAPLPPVRRQSQLFVAPPPPVHREETPESTPVRTRKRRTRPPPPPPTSMVTRTSKRPSPDDHEHMELSANKRRRRSTQEKEEEEESSGESYLTNSDDDAYVPPPSADKGKGRAAPDLHVDPSQKPSNVRAFVGSSDVYIYKRRQAAGPSSSAPLTTQQSSSKESASPKLGGSTNGATASSPKPVATANGAGADKSKAQASSAVNGPSASTTARKELHISTSGLTSSQKQSSTSATATPASASQTIYSPSIFSASTNAKSAVAPPSASSSTQPVKSTQSSAHPPQSRSTSQAANSPRLLPPLPPPSSSSSSSQSPFVTASTLSSHSPALADAQRSLTNTSSILSGHLSVMPEFMPHNLQSTIDHLQRQSSEQLARATQTMGQLQSFVDKMPILEQQLGGISSRLQAMLSDMNAMKDRLGDFD